MEEYLEDELMDTASIKERFRKFVEYARSGNEEDKKKGRLGACEELDGFIGYIIKKKFDAYVKNDPDFRQDLMQSGRMSVIQALDEYDVDKTRPATYFYIFIFHELLGQVIVMKHGMTSYRAAVINKINRVNRDFELRGKVPTLEDYKRETNLTEKQIKNALDIITSTTISLDEPEIFQKEDERYRRLSTESEACSRMNVNAP